MTAKSGLWKELLRDYGVAIGTAVSLALFIRIVFVEVVRIPSPAMEPTLQVGDLVFVKKWPFGIRWPGVTRPLTEGRLPQRGEVVVYNLPWEPGKSFIRRVMAVPGDQVQVAHGKILINGESAGDLPVEDFGPEKVGAQALFVLPDARNAASLGKRSRTWGIIPAQAVRSSAWFIWLSITSPSASLNDSQTVSWWNRIRRERIFSFNFGGKS